MLHFFKFLKIVSLLLHLDCENYLTVYQFDNSIV